MKCELKWELLLMPAESITAALDKGVLHVSVPKIEEPKKAKTVEVTELPTTA